MCCQMRIDVVAAPENLLRSSNMEGSSTCEPIQNIVTKLRGKAVETGRRWLVCLVGSYASSFQFTTTVLALRVCKDLFQHRLSFPSISSDDLLFAEDDPKVVDFLTKRSYIPCKGQAKKEPRCAACTEFASYCLCTSTSEQ